MAGIANFYDLTGIPGAATASLFEHGAMGEVTLRSSPAILHQTKRLGDVAL